MGRGVMLAEIISKVEGTRSPVNVKLTLFYLVFDPIKAHVNGFGLRLFTSAVDNAVSRGIVDLHGSGWLWPSEFVEGVAQCNGLFHVDK